MQIFISSLITGMEPLRAAARNAVLALGHKPVMAEDFDARPQTPQLACLEGVRQADAVILILDERYGAKQSSGLSATQEEYRETQETRPVLAFVKEGVHPESDQAAFIAEVQAWSTGLFRDTFSGAEDLQRKVTRALHEWQLAAGNRHSADRPERAARSGSRPLPARAPRLLQLPFPFGRRRGWSSSARATAKPDRGSHLWGHAAASGAVRSQAYFQRR
jgi:hypothetical protein